jgi:hypothetical protein
VKFIKLVLVAALTAAPALTFAQATTQEQAKNSIVKRELNEQRRIGNGISNDRITPRQGARLERRQMRIRREIRTMRMHNRGRLTLRDRRIIRHRQNVASRRIMRARHMRHRIG